MKRDPMAGRLIALVAVLALSLPGCGKQGESTPPAPANPKDVSNRGTAPPDAGPKPAPTIPLARYAGEWHDPTHYVTIEPDGGGYHRTDLGSAWQEGEVEIRRAEEGASPGHVMRLGGAWITRGEEGEAIRKKHEDPLYTLRLRAEDSLELRGDGGKILYVLKKQPPRPAMKLRDLAGTWRVGEATGGSPNAGLVTQLQGFTVTLDRAGRGKWQTQGGRKGTFTVQERDNRFTVGDFEGQSWQLDPVFTDKDTVVFRLRTTDRSFRLYLQKVKP